jgi:hypothetical protein
MYISSIQTEYASLNEILATLDALCERRAACPNLAATGVREGAHRSVGCRRKRRRCRLALREAQARRMVME